MSYKEMKITCGDSNFKLVANKTIIYDRKVKSLFKIETLSASWFTLRNSKEDYFYRLPYSSFKLAVLNKRFRVLDGKLNPELIELLYF